MTRQTFEEHLVQDPGIAGTAFGTYTTAKTVIPATSLITLPANYFDVGKVLRVKARGGLSTLVTTPGTITFQVMIASVVAWTSGAIQMNATAHTDLPWTLDVDLICRNVTVVHDSQFCEVGEDGLDAHATHGADGVRPRLRLGRREGAGGCP